VVAGFPTRNEVSTVRHVVAVVEEGLCRAGWAGCSALVNADNGSSDGTPAAFGAGPGRIRRLTIATGAEGTGKGTNVLAIFRAALDMGAERVAVSDADVRSIEPGWAGALLDAVDGNAPVMAVPVYRRNRYEV
jgi:glucosylglycerate synthase